MKKKTIYAVHTANINDTLFYATWSDASDFIGDQRAMGFRTTVQKRQVSEEEFYSLMATMALSDGNAVGL